MLTKRKRNVARVVLAAALIAVPAGAIAIAPLSTAQADRETVNQQAWMIPFPGWWAGKVYCMTFPHLPECGGGVIA
jgi:hypothetical protein